MSAGRRPPSEDRWGCTVVHADAVAAARAGMPEAQLMQDAAAFFRVMGDPTRFQILAALDQGELCVCDLSSLLNMSVSAVSHQLRRLRESKLVTARRDGKMVYYTIADDHVHLMLQGCLDHAKEER